MISNFKFQISNYSQKGFVVSIITFFVLLIMLGIALSMSSLAFYRQKISTNSVKSTQSYYTAEAGIEDSLLRLRNNPQIPSMSYVLNIGGTTADVIIPDIIGGSRVIISQGNNIGINRKIQAVYSMDSNGVSFFYGAQVGDGGLTMNNGSRIQGNVFSNGNISRGITEGSGTIDNNAVVAGNHSIDDVTVGGDALTYSCLSPAIIEGNLTYVTGGTISCDVVGSTSEQSEAILAQPLPISQDQINDWRNEAANGGIISGNVNIGNNQTESLGPVKITGDLNLGNNSILNITGTIYVQGSIHFGNTDTIKLNSSYGPLGGVIILDGSIDTGNSTTLAGSGQVGSYLLILSTKDAPLENTIIISNNASGAVFYTVGAGIMVNNNVVVKELTGYKVTLNNNAEIQYESGLANLLFTSGPSGGWKVTSWEEK